MTQPTAAVGGEATPSAAETPMSAFEAIAEETLGTDEEEEQAEEPVETDEGDEPEAEIDEEDIELEADDLPPIEPPVSLTAEEKETFKNLPREAQEFTARRIGELEKGFQSKAQEAAQKERAAYKQAAEYVAQLEADKATQLEQYAQQFTVPEPDPALIATDPVAYAQQVRAHQYYTAQRVEAQRKAEEARGQAQQYHEAIRQHEAEAFHQRLSEALPEFYDETKGPELRKELEATAKSLGFSDEELVNANANAILALKQITDLKAKADKFDKLMAKQMERVRQGKTLPPVSKPGVKQGQDASRKARADAAWQGAKTAKSRDAKAEALADWMTNTGWL